EQGRRATEREAPRSHEVGQTPCGGMRRVDPEVELGDHTVLGELRGHGGFAGLSRRSYAGCGHTNGTPLSHRGYSLVGEAMSSNLSLLLRFGCALGVLAA